MSEMQQSGAIILGIFAGVGVLFVAAIILGTRYGEGAAMAVLIGIPFSGAIVFAILALCGVFG